jgi:hypothetical protein
VDLTKLLPLIKLPANATRNDAEDQTYLTAALDQIT